MKKMKLEPVAGSPPKGSEPSAQTSGHCEPSVQTSVTAGTSTEIKGEVTSSTEGKPLKPKRKSFGRGKPKGDPEEWQKDHHQFLDNMVHRLRTGHQVPGVDRTMRRRVDKAVSHFQLNEQGELMYVGNSRFQKVLYTEEEKHAAFLESHVGHPAAISTFNVLKKHYYFKGMVEYITKKVEMCDQCTAKARPKWKARKPLPLPELTEPSHQAQMVGLDVIGSFERTERGCRHCVMFVDQFTRWVDFYPVPDNESDTIAKAVRKYIYSHGAPETILCNRGKRFISDLNMELLKMFKVQHMVTSAYIPNENHIMHCYSKALRSCITEYTKMGHYDWEYQLDMLAHSLNTSKHGSAQQTAFSMVYGEDYLQPSKIKSESRTTQTVLWPKETVEEEPSSQNVYQREPSGQNVYHLLPDGLESQSVSVVIQNFVHDGGEVETEEAVLGLEYDSHDQQPAASHTQNTSSTANSTTSITGYVIRPAASQSQTQIQNFVHDGGEVETEEAVLGLTYEDHNQQPASSHTQNTSSTANSTTSITGYVIRPATSQSQTQIITDQEYLHEHGYC